MALSKIGAQDIKVKLMKASSGTWYDLVVKDSVEITREPNVASCLTCDVYRDEITPERGDIIKFILDGGHNQFLGSIKSTRKSDVWCSITAYDQIQILNKSEANYIYEDKTATEVVKYVVQANSLAMVDQAQLMDSEYKIQARVEETSWLDVIHNAIDITAQNTGKNFYLWDDCGNICFHSEKWLSEQPKIIVSGGYITNYSYDEDDSDIFTQVTAIEEVNKSNEEEAERKLTIVKNEELEKIFGTINKNVKIQEGENATAIAQNLLDEIDVTSISLTVSGCQGDITVRGGTPIRVDLFSEDNKEYIRGWFKVKSVRHHFKAGYHDMDLTCSLIKMVNDWDNRSPDWSFPE